MLSVILLYKVELVGIQTREPRSTAPSSTSVVPLNFIFEGDNRSFDSQNDAQSWKKEIAKISH